MLARQQQQQQRSEQHLEQSVLSDGSGGGGGGGALGEEGVVAEGADRPVSLRCWCAGCSSGEEPYTVQLGWHMAQLHGDLPGDCSLHTLATDACPVVIRRCKKGEYSSTVQTMSDDEPSLGALPCGWLEEGFELAGAPASGRYRVKPCIASQVEFKVQDLRRQRPGGGLFQLILCRNAAFMYFDAASQLKAARKFAKRLVIGGILSIGISETLPEAARELFEPVSLKLGFYRKVKEVL